MTSNQLSHASLLVLGIAVANGLRPPLLRLGRGALHPRIAVIGFVRGRL